MSDLRIAEWGESRTRALDRAGCRFWTGLAVCASLAMVFLSIVAMDLERVPFPIVFLPCLLPIGTLCLPWLFRRLRSRVEVRRFDADGGEVAVEVRIGLVDSRSGAWALGRDEGMLCHEAGWLVFRGRQSAWSVRTADGKIVTERGFRFTPPGGFERDVTFIAIDRESRLRAVLAEWMGAPAPTGLEVLPPITLSPATARYPIWTWAPPLVTGLLLGSVAITNRTDPLALVLIAMVSLLVLGSTVATARIRLQDLRRAGAIE